MVFSKRHKEVFTYIIVGVLTNFCNYVVYFCLVVSQCNVTLSSSIGFTVGLVLNYKINKSVTFEAKKSSKSLIYKYLFCQLIVMVFQVSISSSVDKVIGKTNAQIPAIVFSGIINYLLLRNFVFN